MIESSKTECISMMLLPLSAVIGMRRLNTWTRCTYELAVLQGVSAESYFPSR